MEKKGKSDILLVGFMALLIIADMLTVLLTIIR